MVRVDVGSLYEEQKKTLSARLKPGMTEEEQKAIFKAATDYGTRVDEALSSAARECKCAVLNTAAIVRLPDSGESEFPMSLTGFDRFWARTRSVQMRKEWLAMMTGCLLASSSSATVISGGMDYPSIWACEEGQVPLVLRC
jgi:hypothetical protein